MPQRPIGSEALTPYCSNAVQEQFLLQLSLSTLVRLHTCISLLPPSFTTLGRKGKLDAPTTR